MQVGTRDVVLARAVVEVRLQFSNSYFIVLNNVYYIPNFRRNLISVSRLLEHNYSISFSNKDIIISRNGLNICSGILENNICMLRSLTRNSLLNAELLKVEKPKAK